MLTVSRVYRCINACWLILLLTPSFGQTEFSRQLENRVYALNNALKYKESQQLLLPILHSDRFSADQKYQAALLLSYTYKRLLDYPATLQFLETARQFARQTTKKNQYLATIQGQEAFVHFDIQAYRKADSLMKTLEKTNFRYIDLENKAKLVMQQGYLLFLAKQYPQAEATYDKAVGWLRTASPCDLPMIYVKKMQLYAAMNRMDKLQAALRESTKSADSCAIIKYNLYTYDELLKIYQGRNDMVAIAATAKKVDSLNKIYARAENIAALHNQRETLLLAEKEHILTREKTERIYLTAGLIGLGILVLGLLAGLLIHIRKKRRIDAEVSRMKNELEAFLAATKTEATTKTESKKESTSHLSERQRDVLTCLANGLSNRDIAEKLFISENTVKYHIKNIYQLLDIKDRKDLLVNFRN